MTMVKSIGGFFGSHKSTAKKALLLGVFWVVEHFDPLGIVSATDIHAEKLFSRFISSQFLYPDNAQNKITIVLIDKNKGIWPPSYKVQAGWLSEILLRQPKAVFVDFIYNQPHGDKSALKVLTDTVNEFKQKQIPIYFPIPVKADKSTCFIDNPLKKYDILDEAPTIKEITDISGEKSFIGWSECGNRYPLYLGGDKHYPTPALTMFKQYCQDNKADKVCKGGFDDDDIKKNYSAPMAIMWGGKTSQENKELFSNFGLPCNSPGFWSQISQLLADIFKDSPERGMRSNCTYTNTVLISMLNSSSSKDCKDPLEDYIKNRYVFIGAAIDLNNDYIINPVNGKVPGVYLLAMAFDNLVNWGPRYYHGLDKTLKTIGTIVALFCVIFLLEAINSMLKTVENAANRKFFFYIRVFLVKFILPIFFGLLLAIIFYCIYHIAPGDWLAITLGAFFINPIEISEIKEAVASDIKAKLRV